MPNPAESHRKLVERLAWSTVVALLVGMLLLFATFRRRVPFSPAALQFLVFPPDNSYMNTAANAAVSPDGRDLAFVAADSTGKELL